MSEHTWASNWDQCKRLLAMLLLGAAFKVHGAQCAEMCWNSVTKVQKERAAG